MLVCCVVIDTRLPRTPKHQHSTYSLPGPGAERSALPCCCDWPVTAPMRRPLCCIFRLAVDRHHSSPEYSVLQSTANHSERSTSSADPATHMTDWRELKLNLIRRSARNLLSSSSLMISSILIQWQNFEARIGLQPGLHCPAALALHLAVLLTLVTFHLQRSLSECVTERWLSALPNHPPHTVCDATRGLAPMALRLLCHVVAASKVNSMPVGPPSAMIRWR